MTVMVINVVTTYITIWLRKKMVLEETKSKQESKNWKSLLMMLSDAVIVCDQNKVLFFNPALHKILHPTVPLVRQSSSATEQKETETEADWAAVLLKVNLRYIVNRQTNL